MPYSFPWGGGEGRGGWVGAAGSDQCIIDQKGDSVQRAW